MDWTGDPDAFDRAGVETQDVDACTRALTGVPPDDWDLVHHRLRVKLDAIRLIPDAEDAEGRDTTSATVMPEDLVRRAQVLDAKKQALRDEDAPRRGGAARPRE
jgi:hypothetical protein